MTHILWDSFTHTEYWLGRNWEFLRQNVQLPLVGARPWAAVFQYISSAAGLIVILLWFAKWYRETPPVHSKQDQPRYHRDRIAVVIAFVASILAGIVRAADSGVPSGVHGAQRFMTDASITGITVFCLAILIYGFVRVRISDAAETA